MSVSSIVLILLAVALLVGVVSLFFAVSKPRAYLPKGSRAPHKENQELHQEQHREQFRPAPRASVEDENRHEERLRQYSISIPSRRHRAEYAELAQANREEYARGSAVERAP